jgi:hypothetical protein
LFISFRAWSFAIKKWMNNHLDGTRKKKTHDVEVRKNEKFRVTLSLVEPPFKFPMKYNNLYLKNLGYIGGH